MRIYLVRHAQTTHNKYRICQGQYDSELTEEGVEQARLVAERLKGYSFSKVYSSDLQRSKNTALAITKHQETEPIFDKRLREMAQGIYENIPYKEVPYDSIDYDDINSKFPEGESPQDHIDRVKMFLDEIELAHNTLIVSHGGTIKALLCNLTGEDFFKVRNRKFDNTCIYILRKNGDKFEIELENCTKHLE